MTIEIDTENKTVTIKSYGHTFKEIEAKLKKYLGKDWGEYKLCAEGPITYIPSYPNPYPSIPYWHTPYPTVTTVGEMPFQLTSGVTTNLINL